MKFKKNLLHPASAILGTALLMGGCASPADQAPSTKLPAQRLGMANPASVHCVNKGGQVVIVKDSQGNEAGLCKLADGTQIDEWELFRRDNPSGQTNSDRK